MVFANREQAEPGHNMSITYLQERPSKIATKAPLFRHPISRKNFLVQYINSVTLCRISTERIRQKVDLYLQPTNRL